MRTPVLGSALAPPQQNLTTKRRTQAFYTSELRPPICRRLHARASGERTPIFCRSLQKLMCIKRQSAAQTQWATACPGQTTMSIQSPLAALGPLPVGPRRVHSCPVSWQRWASCLCHAGSFPPQASIWVGSVQCCSRTSPAWACTPTHQSQSRWFPALRVTPLPGRPFPLLLAQPPTWRPLSIFETSSGGPPLRVCVNSPRISFFLYFLDRFRLLFSFRVGAGFDRPLLCVVFSFCL